MQYRRFAVGIRPICIWGDNLSEVDRRFIERLDPAYFDYLADAHATESDDPALQHRAALALRTQYAHGTETLLALLCAALQAPDSISGWLNQYRTHELRDVVSKISGWESILARFSMERGWQGVADLVLASLVLEDKEKERRIKKYFGTLWSRMASDFLDHDQQDEYNSFKHGLRVRTGGFSLAMGLETVPGVPAAPEHMRSFGASRFGASFLSMEQLEQNRPHYKLTEHSRNWRPQNFMYALKLIAISIQNVRSFLLISEHEVPAVDVQFVWPSPEAAFDEAWASAGDTGSFSTSDIITWDMISPLTNDEILAVYGEPRQP